MTDTKASPYKWIAARIESLDPHQDYEEIVRLSSCYYANDFINNMMYGVILPTLIKEEWAARAIWREDGGKILHKANLRVEDTEHHNMTWLYYGPSDKRCLDSIAYINNLHARLEEKVTPNCYGHNDDYIYTLASAALTGHRFALRLGLPGFTPKQKIAHHLFYQEISKHFVSHHPGGIRKPLVGFPENWDDTVAWCEQHEAKEWPTDPRSELIAEAVWAQFGFKYFPPRLRWLGRTIQVSLSMPENIKAIGAKDVHPWTRAVVIFLMSWMFWLLAFAPDPRPGESLVEKQERVSKEEKTLRMKEMVKADRMFCPYFAEKFRDRRPGCPYFVKLGDEL